MSNSGNSLNLCSLDASPLEAVETFKYLGVWLDTDLSLKTHKQSIKNKPYSFLKTYRFLEKNNTYCFTFHVKKKVSLSCSYRFKIMVTLFIKTLLLHVFTLFM